MCLKLKEKITNPFALAIGYFLMCYNLQLLCV
jgi:hypothetical protein